MVATRMLQDLVKALRRARWATLMHDPAYGLPRTSTLGIWVNTYTPLLRASDETDGQSRTHAGQGAGKREGFRGTLRARLDGEGQQGGEVRGVRRYPEDARGFGALTRRRSLRRSAATVGEVVRASGNFGRLLRGPASSCPPALRDQCKVRSLSQNARSRAPL